VKTIIYGIISDVHGNYLALEKCMEEMEKFKVDKFLFLGDLFGYFPEGMRCLDLLTAYNFEFLLGNHDAMLLSLLSYDKKKKSIYQFESDIQHLGKERKLFLQSLLPYKILNFGTKKALFVHGSPWDPLQGYVYPDVDLNYFCDLDYDLVFMGHTHRPFLFKMKEKHLINVGSVGLPRDKGKLGSFCIFDTNNNDSKIVRFLLPMKEIVGSYIFLHQDVKNCLYR